MRFSAPQKSFKRPESFDALIADDPFDLLKDVGEKRASMTVSEKVQSQFAEIAEFVKQNQRLPADDSDDFDEELLAIKFKELAKQSPEGVAYCESLIEGHKVKQVQVVRRHLTYEEELSQKVDDMQTHLYESIDDVLSDDPLGLLADVKGKPAEHESWRENTTRNISASMDQATAKAKTCEEFYRYEHFFTEINELLKEGHLRAIDVLGDTGSIEVGDIFIIKGVMSIIASMDEHNVFKDANGRRQQRVRQIMDNGKESNPFNMSIRAGFYKSELQCKRIINTDSQGYEYLRGLNKDLRDLNKGSGNSVLSGYIYILATQSKDPIIKNFLKESELVKIGYTTTDVATRIANAENEPTYLCAPVKVLKTFSCYNFDARNLEDVLHTILASHRLNVELKDHTGKKYHPREWFTVNVNTASQIIEHIFAQDINDYYIDEIQGKLRRKQSKNDKA